MAPADRSLAEPFARTALNGTDFAIVAATLAAAYETGTGVPANLAEAYALQRAYERTHDPSLPVRPDATLPRLAASLSPEEIAAAEARASDWYRLNLR